MPHAIAFSPHLDDAAFSCGGTLAGLARNGWDVTLCTAFTRSVCNPTGFALACQLDKGLPPDVDYMALRRAEDENACGHLGCRPVWLPFAEAPHRGYGNPRELFGPLLESDDVAAALTDALAGVLNRGADLVLAPQAIGGHIDHVQLVLALRRILPLHTPILWWTDFPYSTRPHTHPAQPFAATMNPLPARAFPADTAARHAACAAYVTQIGFQFGGADGLARALADAGRFETMRVQGAPPGRLPAAFADSWQAAYP